MSKANPRQYRSGSVYQRASDGRWIGTIEAGVTIEGKRRRVTVSAKTQAKCKAAVKAKQDDLAKNGVPTAGVETRTTVAAWAETWLSRTTKELRPKSYITDCTAVRKWIIPIIGKKRLDELTPAHIVAVSDAIAETRSTSTALRYHATLHKMLVAATVWGHGVPPRVLLMKGPSKAAHDRGELPTDHARAFLTAAADDPLSATRWAAGLLQGMRQGECLGLTWSCVDLDNSVIDVSWQLQPIPYMHGCPKVRPCGRRFGGDCPQRKFRMPDGYEYHHLIDRFHLVRPKTENGKRDIPLVPWMTAALRAWQAVAPPNPYDLVWANRDGTIRTSQQDRDEWAWLQERAQIAKRNRDGTTRPYVMHELRHTAATLLLHARVDPEVIRAILGHANTKQIREYQHVSLDLSRRALDGVAQTLQLE